MECDGQKLYVRNYCAWLDAFARARCLILRAGAGQRSKVIPCTISRKNGAHVNARRTHHNRILSMYVCWSTKNVFVEAKEGRSRNGWARALPRSDGTAFNSPRGATPNARQWRIVSECYGVECQTFQFKHQISNRQRANKTNFSRHCLPFAISLGCPTASAMFALQVVCGVCFMCDDNSRAMFAVEASRDCYRK